MSRKRIREKYIPKHFENGGFSTDFFATIYKRMLESNIWKSLSKNAKLLYIYCKMEASSDKDKAKPVVIKLTQEKMCASFTMNKYKWCDKYGLYTNHSQFEKDMASLVEAGFVDVVENGKSNRTKTIYKLSSRWVANNCQCGK